MDSVVDMKIALLFKKTPKIDESLLLFSGFRPGMTQRVVASRSSNVTLAAGWNMQYVCIQI